MKLKGYVISDEGSPVSNATVEVFKQGEGTATDSTTSNSSGLWSFTGLTADAYEVKISYASEVRWIYPDIIFQVEDIIDLDGNTFFQPEVGALQDYHMAGSADIEVEAGLDSEFAAEATAQTTILDAYQTALSGTFVYPGQYRIKFDIHNSDTNTTTQARISVTVAGGTDWSEEFTTDSPHDTWKSIEYDFTSGQAVAADDTISIQFRRSGGDSGDTASIRNIEILGKKVAAVSDDPDFVKD